MVMLLCGIRSVSFELTPFGGVADAIELDCAPAWKRMLIAASGIAASVLGAWIAWNNMPNTDFWYAFFQISVVLAVFNTLPAWPLDGARVLAALANLVGLENVCRKAAKFFTCVLGMGMVCLGLYGVWRGIMNPTLLFAGPYLCYSAKMESWSNKVRKIAQSGRKLKSAAVVPAAMWAVSTGWDRETLIQMIDKMQPGRYQLFVQIDERDGSIMEYWTEQKLIERLSCMEGIDDPKT